ncbi:ester cyclase [Streptomyces sp. NPDC002889]|uniref:ester cyclase n=1 Tax=Streptomyces sp. NPDC002889 TaxID=3364669 RepID=UPI0036AD29DF
MKFVQVIDYKTSKFDGVNELMDRWAEQTQGKRTATHALTGKDRADASHYMEIVEFESYDDAMKNSHLPETEQIFQEMVALCDGMPSFTDLDVVRDEQLNTAAVRRFFHEIAAGGNLDALSEVFAPDYKDHDPLREEGEPDVGLDMMRADVTGWRDAFDFTFDLERQVTEGDDVATSWRWTGRHKGEFQGIAPTRRQCTMTGTTIFRFEDGMIKEGWWHYDMLGLLRQLGALG